MVVKNILFMVASTVLFLGSELNSDFDTDRFIMM